jgi:hypothetical protein
MHGRTLLLIETARIAPGTAFIAGYVFILKVQVLFENRVPQL